MNEPTLLTSKPNSPRGRQVNLTFLRSFLVSASTPRQIRYQDTLVHIEGLPMRERPADLVWGVHGSRSISDASIYFSRASLDEGKLLYEIDMSVYFDNLRKSTTSVTEAIVKESGLLSAGRLKAEYQQEVRQEILGYLKEKVPQKILSQAEEMELEDLLIQFPSAVWRYMRERPWLRGFVHPALVRVAEATDKRPAVNARLQIITFRVEPERIEQATVRQRPEIPITI